MADNQTAHRSRITPPTTRWLLSMSDGQYPAPVADLADPARRRISAVTTRSTTCADLLACWQRRTDLDVLVAGCRHHGAACYALLNPHWPGGGIDVSQAALAHEQRLKDRHKLDNLTLHHCS